MSPTLWYSVSPTLIVIHGKAIEGLKSLYCNYGHLRSGFPSKFQLSIQYFITSWWQEKPWYLVNGWTHPSCMTIFHKNCHLKSTIVVGGVGQTLNHPLQTMGRGGGNLPRQFLPPPEKFLNPTENMSPAPPNFKKNIALAFLKVS